MRYSFHMLIQSLLSSDYSTSKLFVLVPTILAEWPSLPGLSRKGIDLTESDVLRLLPVCTPPD